MLHDIYATRALITYKARVCKEAFAEGRKFILCSFAEGGKVLIFKGKLKTGEDLLYEKNRLGVISHQTRGEGRGHGLG